MRTCSKSFALAYPRVVQMYDVRVNASSAKYLAFCALEHLMEINFSIRDDLKEWMTGLEADVHSGVKSE
jgi:hypothetical protein